MTDPNDIAALREEGDLRDYMRSLIRPTNTPTTTRGSRRKNTWGAIPIPPDHKPGAWPPGTRPPGPAPEHSLPAEQWTAAARHHSNELNRPDQPCDCGHCPPREDPATGSHPDTPTDAHHGAA